jgi:ribosomal protein S27AE
MTENLLRIQEIGLDAFVADEKVRWACPECGSLLCVHLPQCGVCGRSRDLSAQPGEGS